MPTTTARAISGDPEVLSLVRQLRDRLSEGRAGQAARGLSSLIDELYYGVLTGAELTLVREAGYIGEERAVALLDGDDTRLASLVRDGDIAVVEDARGRKLFDVEDVVKYLRFAAYLEASRAVGDLSPSPRP